MDSPAGVPPVPNYSAVYSETEKSKRMEAHLADKDAERLEEVFRLREE